MSKLLEALSASYWYDEQENLLVALDPDCDDEHAAHPVKDLLDYRHLSGSSPIVARMTSALRTPKPGEVWAVRRDEYDWEVGIVDKEGCIDTLSYYVRPGVEGIQRRFVAEGVPA